MVEVALARRHRPGDRLDPRRPRGHDRRLDRRAADRPGQRARAQRRPGAHRRRRSTSSGACLGALVFGQLTDRFGRKKLFMVDAAASTCWRRSPRRSPRAPLYFFACRFFTGAGIGGEYAAINSAIDELIPARVRGRVDLIINGSYWLGAAFGALGALRPARQTSSRPTSAGASRSGSARSSASASCSCAGTCPRARAGCSSTAARRRPSGSSTRSSARSRGDPGEPLDEPGASITVRQRRTHLAARGRHDGVQDLPEALGPRPRAVRRPGVHLQLGDLRPRHVPGRVLRHQRRRRPALPGAVRGLATSSARCCSGTCSTPSGASR